LLRGMTRLTIYAVSSLTCSFYAEPICFAAEYILYDKKSKYRKRLLLFITINIKKIYYRSILSSFDHLPLRLGKGHRRDRSVGIGMNGQSSSLAGTPRDRAAPTPDSALYRRYGLRTRRKNWSNWGSSRRETMR
jgi:hypothetical protein